MKRPLYALFVLSALLLPMPLMGQTLSDRWILPDDSLEAHVVRFAAAWQPHKQQPPQISQTLPFSLHLRLFNIAPSGWVLACNDSRARRILAYSQEGRMDTSTLNEAARDWLQGYEDEIAHLCDTVPAPSFHLFVPAASKTDPSSHRHSASKDVYVPDEMPPLLPTHWSQYGNGYNSMTPFDVVIANHSPDLAYLEGHPTVGCVALAMGQIMRYYSYPWHGFGEHCYSCQGEYPGWRYGTVCTNFAETMYDYYNMPPALSENSTDDEVLAVATLLSHCGAACNMRYNIDSRGSSGAAMGDILEGAKRFFHFKPSAHLIHRFDHPTWQWIDSLKNEIGNRRPVLYDGGQPLYGSKHAFVLDGYDNNDYFHVNWGWGGSSDGYYSLTSTQGTGRTYFQGDQCALMGFEPHYGPMPLVAMASPLQLDSNVFEADSSVSGFFSVTNLGDAATSFYLGTFVFNENLQLLDTLDWTYVTLRPGDTLNHRFAKRIHRDEGNYAAQVQFLHDAHSPIIWQRMEFCSIFLSNTKWFSIAGIAAIDPLLSAQQFRFFPNPACGSVTLAFQDLHGTAQVRLLDMNGHILRSEVLHPHQGTSFSFDLSGIPAGMYLVQVLSPHFTTIQKLLVR